MLILFVVQNLPVTGSAFNLINIRTSQQRAISDMGRSVAGTQAMSELQFGSRPPVDLEKSVDHRHHIGIEGSESETSSTLGASAGAT